MRRIRRWQTGAWAAAAGALVALLASAGPALAARVASVSPTGEVATVRQVVVRFDEAVVPAGEAIEAIAHVEHQLMMKRSFVGVRAT